MLLKLSQSLQVRPSLEKRIWATPLKLSLAVMRSVTVTEKVEVAPLLMVSEPVGGVLS
jgi:hypothetical protein